MDLDLTSFCAECESVNKEFVIHIGIDFGTDGTGLSYVMANDPLKQVYIHNEWGAMGKRITQKPKTALMIYEFDEDEDIVFGQDAIDQYTRANLKKQKKLLFFEKFKMSLYGEYDENGQMRIKPTLTAANGRTFSSEKVFIAAFTRIKTAIELYFRRRKIKVKDNQRQYIVTVPAIWNEKAKYLMKKWGKKAGLLQENVKNQLKIVYEPDCGALSVQYKIRTILQQNGGLFITPKKADVNTDERKLTDEEEEGLVNIEWMGDRYSSVQAFGNHKNCSFKGNDKYMLIDVGGGTCDIACHQLLCDLYIPDNNNSKVSLFGIKEVLAPSGGNWGSCFIDEAFVVQLENIFGVEFIANFKNEASGVFQDLLECFRSSKHSFGDNPQFSGQHMIELRKPAMQYLENKFGDDLDLGEMFAAASKKLFDNNSNMISYARKGFYDYLIFDEKVWIIMFEHVITPIIEHCKKLLLNPMMKHCRFMCLVGGLSCNKYFQRRIILEFGRKMAIVIPDKPLMAVVEGAALMGVTPHYIQARVLSRTYGMRVALLEQQCKQFNIPAEHMGNEENRMVIQNKMWIDNCFYIVARKDETIFTHQVVKRRTRRRHRNHNRICKKILFSDEVNPTVCKPKNILASFTVLFDGDNENELDIENEFHFHDTMLRVFAYPKNQEHNKEEIDLEYQYYGGEQEKQCVEVEGTVESCREGEDYNAWNNNSMNNNQNNKP